MSRKCWVLQRRGRGTARRLPCRRCHRPRVITESPIEVLQANSHKLQTLPAWSVVRRRSCVNRPSFVPHVHTRDAYAHGINVSASSGIRPSLRVWYHCQPILITCLVSVSTHPHYVFGISVSSSSGRVRYQCQLVLVTCLASVSAHFNYVSGMCVISSSLRVWYQCQLILITCVVCVSAHPHYVSGIFVSSSSLCVCVPFVIRPFESRSYLTNFSLILYIVPCYRAFCRALFC